MIMILKVIKGLRQVQEQAIELLLNTKQ